MISGPYRRRLWRTLLVFAGTILFAILLANDVITVPSKTVMLAGASIIIAVLIVIRAQQPSILKKVPQFTVTSKSKDQFRYKGYLLSFRRTEMNQIRILDPPDICKSTNKRLNSDLEIAGYECRLSCIWGKPTLFVINKLSAENITDLPLIIDGMLEELRNQGLLEDDS